MTDFAPPPAPGPAAGGPRPASPQQQPDNGIGVAALILGIVALVGFGFPLTIVAAILAIVFGVKGRNRADAGLATNHGQATAGLVLGIVALSLKVGGLAVLGIWGGWCWF